MSFLRCLSWTVCTFAIFAQPLLAFAEQAPKTGAPLQALLREWVQMQTDPVDAHVPSDHVSRLHADHNWIPKNLQQPQLPLKWHPRVIDALYTLTHDKKGRDKVNAWLKAMPTYDGLVDPALAERGMSRELKCVALIESDYNPRARSQVGALGMWQLMPETADAHGLTRSTWVDERLDPERSTVAALDILDGLLRRFGSHELAFAAYNMGLNGVYNALKRYNTNDFWSLNELDGVFPEETRNYVARISACVLILDNLNQFGFRAPNAGAALTSVAVPSGIKFNEVAHLAGMNPNDLRSANPQFLRDVLPPESMPWSMHMPLAPAERLTRALETLDRSTLMKSARLEPGMTVDAFAERYHTSADEVFALNGLSKKVSAGENTWLFLPIDASPPEPPLAFVPKRAFFVSGATRLFYRVERGENLRMIAHRMGATLEDIVAWNELDARATLPLGMLVQVFADAGHNPERLRALRESDVRVVVRGSRAFYEAHEKSRGRQPFDYTVREGDTVEALSKRFSQSIASIRAINQLDSNALLSLGQTLLLFTNAASLPTPSSAPNEISTL